MFHNCSEETRMFFLVSAAVFYDADFMTSSTSNAEFLVTVSITGSKLTFENIPFNSGHQAIVCMSVLQLSPCSSNVWKVYNNSRCVFSLLGRRGDQRSKKWQSVFTRLLPCKQLRGLRPRIHERRLPAAPAPLWRRCTAPGSAASARYLLARPQQELPPAARETQHHSMLVETFKDCLCVGCSRSMDFSHWKQVASSSRK